MSSLAAPRCRHIKVSGTQCGSPALRNKNFCFYHQQDRPMTVECYSEGEYATGEIALPVFEDAHSIQTVIRQVVQMVLQKRIERKTASLLLYALQIASSNLKRMELEKPQPDQVVINIETESETPMAAMIEDETAQESSDEEIKRSDEDLPPGTIQACYRPYSRIRLLHRETASCGDGAEPALSGAEGPRPAGRRTAPTRGRRK
jgi:hypothetical protein